MIEYTTINGKIEEINLDAPKATPIRTKRGPKRITRAQRRARRRAKIHNKILLTVTTIAGLLTLAAMATPLEPGYRPEYRSGLIAAILICVAWIALFAYANSGIRERRRSVQKRKLMIQGNPMLREAEREMIRKKELGAMQGARRTEVQL